jgi:hypothetical protein
VTTTVPNFVRGAVVPITLGFKALESSMGSIHAAIFIGSICILSGIIAILSLPETFSKDLNYHEE